MTPWLTAIVVAAFVAGCGGSSGDEPPAKPSREQVDELVANTHEPVYWWASGPAATSSARSATTAAAAWILLREVHVRPGKRLLRHGVLATGRRDLRGLSNADLEGGGTPAGCWHGVGRTVVLLYGCDP